MMRQLQADFVKEEVVRMIRPERIGLSALARRDNNKTYILSAKKKKKK